MKLIHDDEEDLFLHDFSRKKADDNPSGEQDSTQTRLPASQEFSFGPTREQRRGTSRRGCGFFFWFFFILLVALGTAFYIRYFVPHTTESQTRGYVTLVEKRGIIFKTFEGELVSETQLSDSSRIYSRDFRFSIPDDSLGRLLQSCQGTGRPVTVTTKTYYGSLPWRGANNTILTDISLQ